MSVEFSGAARRAQYDALLYYADISYPLADKFDRAVTKAVNIAAQFPYSNRDRGDGFRFQFVKTFPYFLVYEIIDDDRIIVLTIANSSRMPEYWREEL